MPPRLQRQNRLFMYLFNEKYGMQQAVEIRLSSRVICSAHITLDVKVEFLPLAASYTILLIYKTIFKKCY